MCMTGQKLMYVSGRVSLDIVFSGERRGKGCETERAPETLQKTKKSTESQGHPKKHNPDRKTKRKLSWGRKLARKIVLKF